MEPVKCVCGGDADVAWTSDGRTWVECCGECGRVGGSRPDKKGAIADWNADMCAIKMHDRLVDTLGAIANWLECRDVYAREGSGEPSLCQWVKDDIGALLGEAKGEE